MAEPIAEQLQSLAVPIASLNLDPANARQHPAKNLDAIKSSLAKFGQRKPIVVQREGMTVRAGNGTVIAAKALGWETIAAVILDDDNATASQFAIADNRTGELATWDDETLASLLDGMDSDTLTALAFDEKDMRELLRGLAPEVTEDEVPEPPEVPVTKLGDLIVMGGHRLLCGDNANLPSDWAFDVVVTDPPYGMDYRGTAGTAQEGMDNTQRRDVKPVHGDDREFDPTPWLSKTDGDVLLWGADWYCHLLPPGGSWVVWDKRASEAADAIPGAPFEVCWSRRRQARRFIRVAWGGWNNKDLQETPSGGTQPRSLSP